MGISPLGFPVHDISQERILEWVPFISLGDLPNPGIRPTSLVLQADSFTDWATRETQKLAPELAQSPRGSLLYWYFPFPFWIMRWFKWSQGETKVIRVLELCLSSEQWLIFSLHRSVSMFDKRYGYKATILSAYAMGFSCLLLSLRLSTKGSKAALKQTKFQTWEEKVDFSPSSTHKHFPLVCSRLDPPPQYFPVWYSYHLYLSL